MANSKLYEPTVQQLLLAGLSEKDIKLLAAATESPSGDTRPLASKLLWWGRGKIGPAFGMGLLADCLLATDGFQVIGTFLSPAESAGFPSPKPPDFFPIHTGAIPGNGESPEAPDFWKELERCGKNHEFPFPLLTTALDRAIGALERLIAAIPAVPHVWIIIADNDLYFCRRERLGSETTCGMEWIASIPNTSPALRERCFGKSPIEKTDWAMLINADYLLRGLQFIRALESSGGCIFYLRNAISPLLITSQGGERFALIQPMYSDSERTAGLDVPAPPPALTIPCGSAFRKAIANLATFCADERPVPVLSGIHLVVRGRRVFAEACSLKAALQVVLFEAAKKPLPGLDMAVPGFDIVVPGAKLAAWVAALPQNCRTITVGVTRRHRNRRWVSVVFTADGASTLELPYWSGAEFPALPQPEGDEVWVQTGVSASAFSKALKQAKYNTDPTSGLDVYREVHLEIRDSRMRVAGTTGRRAVVMAIPVPPVEGPAYARIPRELITPITDVLAATVPAVLVDVQDNLHRSGLVQIKEGRPNGFVITLFSNLRKPSENLFAKLDATASGKGILHEIGSPARLAAAIKTTGGDSSFVRLFIKDTTLFVQGESADATPRAVMVLLPSGNAPESSEWLVEAAAFAAILRAMDAALKMPPKNLRVIKSFRMAFPPERRGPIVLTVGDSWAAIMPINEK